MTSRATKHRLTARERSALMTGAYAVIAAWLVTLGADYATDPKPYAAGLSFGLGAGNLLLAWLRWREVRSPYPHWADDS